MNVIKVIQTKALPVRLVQQAAGPVRLVRAETPNVRLVHEGGVVNIGGAASAAELPMALNLRTVLSTQKAIKA